jgi:hypothetical protein
VLRFVGWTRVVSLHVARVGKSRPVELRGHCVEMSSAPSYLPFVELIEPTDASAMIAIQWPAKATLASASQYEYAPATAVCILANGNVVLMRIRRERRL